MYENAVNSGLPQDKQLVLGQMFDYFTDCTLGQVPFLADGGENYCHNEHYLKGRLTDDTEREHWRNLRIDVFSGLVIDAINRKSVGARVLIIGVMPHIIFPSIIEEACGRWQLTTSRSKALMSTLISSLLFLLTSVLSFMD
jgi:hypothetical protein